MAASCPGGVPGRRTGSTLIGVAVIAAADKLLPMVFSEYRQWADFVKICLGLIVIISVTVPAATAIIKHRRDRKLALEL